MCVCVYCIYAYTCERIHVYISICHTYTSTCIWQSYIYACMCVYMLVCVYICVYIYIRIYVVYIYVHACMYVCIHVYAEICTCMNVHIHALRKYTCIHTQVYVYVYTYIHIHTFMYMHEYI